MEKKIKKKKLNIKRLFFFLIFLCLIILFVYCLSKIKLKNIIIDGNNYYTDEYIIEKLGLDDYPRFLTINPFKLKNNLKNEELIEKVEVKCKIDFTIEIDILEYKILYQRKSDSMYVLNNGEEKYLQEIVGIPLLINYYPNTLNEKAIKSFSKLDKDIIKKISMIEYSKTEADDERFLLYMSDGNLVYINLNRMENLNKYTEIINQVGTKKGILNLDSGNYFEIKE